MDGTSATSRQARNSFFGYTPKEDDRLASVDVVTLVQEPTAHLGGGLPGARPLSFGSASPGRTLKGPLTSSGGAVIAAGSMSSKSPGAAARSPPSPRTGSLPKGIVMGKDRFTSSLGAGGGAALVATVPYRSDLDRHDAFEARLDAVFARTDLLRRVDDEYERLARRETARIRAVHQTQTLRQQAALAAAVGRPIDGRGLASVSATVEGGRAGHLSPSRSTVRGAPDAALSASHQNVSAVASVTAGTAFPMDDRPAKYHLRSTVDPSLWRSASERLHFYSGAPPRETPDNTLRNSTQWRVDDFEYARPSPAASMAFTTALAATTGGGGGAGRGAGAAGSSMHMPPASLIATRTAALTVPREPTVDAEAPRGKRQYASLHNAGAGAATTLSWEP